MEKIIRVNITDKAEQPTWTPMTAEEIADSRSRMDWRTVRDSDARMVNLESVGTVIDPDGMTYPMLVDGGYDADAGTHVSDIEKDGDWMNNLSDADRSKLADLI